MIDKFDSFVALAKQKYKKTLTSVEEKLLKAIVAGEVADYQVKSLALNNSAQARTSKKEEILSAKFIEWLCTDVEAFQYFTNHGLQVCGAKIAGKLNLEFVKFESLLYFTECVFTEKIILRGAKVEEVKFDGSQVVGINADLIEVRGNLYLHNGFQSKGKVSIAGAIIGSTLDCSRGHFSNTNKKGDALFADNIEVKADVFMSNGFKAEGRVTLSGATIDGKLDCSKGHFFNKEADGLSANNYALSANNNYALSANNIEVKGSVFLSNGFKAEGIVSLGEANIGGQLNCNKGHFYNKGGYALLTGNIEVKAHLFLRKGFKAEGIVSLSGATIGGVLECSDSCFSNPEKDALLTENIEVKAHLLLRKGFKAEGRVSLSGATIGGQLDCRQGHFCNPEKNALNANNIEVKADVLLSNDFNAEGEVDLTAANIKGNLDCTNGNFSNEKGNVLSAEGINVDGDIILDRGTFKGKIYLVSARVDDTLSMVKIKLNFPLYLFILYSFIKNIKNYRVASLLQKEYQRRESASHYMKLDLQFARIARLKDDEQSWPQQNNLNLDGFIYQKFSTDNNTPKDSKTRYKWLRLQPDFFPQTYEQLAEVFKKEGEPDAAREILIRKKRDIKPKLNYLDQFWNSILDVTIVYGYQPAKALFWSSIFILAGFYFFNLGYENCAELISNNKCLFSPSSRIIPYIKDEQTNENKKIDIDYPKFNSFWYSLDTFIPIVDLYHVRMITYNKAKIITVEVFKLYGQKNCDRQLPLCSDERL